MPRSWHIPQPLSHLQWLPRDPLYRLTKSFFLYRAYEVGVGREHHSPCFPAGTLLPSEFPCTEHCISLSRLFLYHLFVVFLRLQCKHPSMWTLQFINWIGLGAGSVNIFSSFISHLGLWSWIKILKSTQRVNWSEQDGQWMRRKLNLVCTRQGSPALCESFRSLTLTVWKWRCLEDFCQTPDSTRIWRVL